MKLLLFIAAFLICSAGIQAQTKSIKPAPKKTAPKGKSIAKKNVKKIKTSSGNNEFEELICYEDGPCTFNILRGDTLVYEVNAAGKHYNLLVVPNKFDATTIADFSWIATAPENKAGHITINTKGLTTSKKYISNLPAGELKLADASSIWMTSSNFKEIAKGQTSIAFDNNQPESFSSPEADAVTVAVNYKGKPLNLEGFALENKAEGQPDRKEIWVLNVSTNLLIIRMDIGWTMQLKEVRERRTR
jgi:hypothetical protein